MDFASYYVIRPNSRLNSTLDEISEDWPCLLRAPVLWSRVEHKSEVYSVRMWSELRIIQVKLMFMADLAAEYLNDCSEERTSFQEFVHSLLSFPPIRLEAFDQWWTIERLESLDTQYEQAEAELPSWVRCAIKPPDVEGANEWIGSLVADNLSQKKDE